MTCRRIVIAAGLASFAIAFVELLGPSFPSGNASSIDAYFVDHRSWALSAVFIQGVANVVWATFVSLYAWLVARAGSPAAAVVGATGGLLNLAVSLAGLSCIAALAFGIAGRGDPGVSSAFFVLSTTTLVISNFMLALMAAGFAAAGVLPKAFRVFTAGVGAVFLAGGASLAQHGALSPNGAVQFATYILELVWTVTASILLWRGRPAPTDD